MVQKQREREPQWKQKVKEQLANGKLLEASLAYRKENPGKSLLSDSDPGLSRAVYAAALKREQEIRA